MSNLLILIPLVTFFAMNMGASGIAPSFAAAYGGRLIKRYNAVVLFSVFVFLGAIVLGRNVSLTLGKNLLPKEYLGFQTAMVVIFSACASLFLANLLKIPQSTSQVTVGAIIGAGLYFKHLYVKTLLLKILPLWVILPLASYVLTFLLYKIIYPPRHGNLGLYEKIFTHEDKIKKVSIAVSCYVGFAIGSNNVANAVGPLYGAGVINVISGLILISPLFGLGALVLGKGNLETAGKEIVPLGIFSSTLVAFVTATLLLIASFLGIPQSLVQLSIFSIFAVSSLKNGHRSTLDLHVTRRTFLIWAITPLLSLFISYAGLWLINRGRLF